MKSLLQYCTILIAIGLVNTQAQAGKIDPNLPRISYIQYPSFDLSAGCLPPYAPKQEVTVVGIILLNEAR